MSKESEQKVAADLIQAALLRVTSPRPLPAPELVGRAPLALQRAGLDAAPVEPHILTRVEQSASLRASVVLLEEAASDGPPMTEAEIVAEVRHVHQQRAEQAEAEAKEHSEEQDKGEEKNEEKNEKKKDPYSLD